MIQLQEKRLTTEKLSEMSAREAVTEALIDIARTNENIVVLTADLGSTITVNKFAKHYPSRYFNIGIAEQNLMGVAAGLASEGLIPFTATFAVYASMRACELVRNAIAYTKANVKIIASHAGITVGKNGTTHQALEDIAIMRAIPNMSVVVPADSIETYQAVKAIADYNGPVYIRLGRPKFPKVSKNDYVFQLGKAVVIKDGKDLTLVATGIMVSMCLEAIRILKMDGIDVRLINIHTIKPLDRETVINCAVETRAIVTVEEHNIVGGLGSAVSEVVSGSCPVPIEYVGIKDTFAESGDPDELMKKNGLTVEDIVLASKRVLLRKTEML
ncbi:MAG TPA: transketolase family protein [Ruminiclostridium sp.]|nr:transketolase family protein [Ruminiclostridium sp.]